MDPTKIFILVNDARVSLADFAAMERSKVVSVDASGCTALATLGDLPQARTVDASGCTALATLGDLPKAAVIKNEKWTAYIAGGADSRGYFFESLIIRDGSERRYLAGCRNYALDEARAHWGPGGPSDRPDCLALVNGMAEQAQRLDMAERIEDAV